MTRKLTILGCGSSAGVPRVGLGWGACDPANPKNRRRRCALLIEQAGPGGMTSVLVDAGPDLRMQLLDANVSRLDAALLTHAHADHFHGVDDLRSLVLHMRRKVDLYMDQPTAQVMHASFGYLFATPEGSQYPPLLNDHRLLHGQAFTIDGPGGRVDLIPFRLEHGEIDALGFRFGACAYTPDLKAIPSGSVPYLENLDLWIIDSLRFTEHPTHLCVAEALDWITRMRPRRAVLTNLSSEVDYEVLRRELPAHVTPAFDGMVIPT